jgi:D-beta-D-heptose 7-phosphate kinase / D-beta-D-heptose 1-phosphate adenosyltransferase
MKTEIPNFALARVLVIGDVMLDRYWHGDTERISPEAPVPVLHVRQMEDRPGGAANVALNIQALGGRAVLLGLVGSDDVAVNLDFKLKQSAIEHYFIPIAGVPTISKLRIIGRNQQLLRLDLEEHFIDYDIDAMLMLYNKQLQNVNVVILSDYGKGTLKYSNKFIELAKKANIPVLVDPKNKDFSIYHGATIITPNLTEFEAVVGHCIDEADLEQKALNLLQKYDFKAVLVTRGSKGMSLICADKQATHLSAHAREVYDVTGAGDTVIATLAAAIAAGDDLETAALLANTAASVVVKKLGAATVSRAELCRALHHNYDHDVWQGVVNEEYLLQQVAAAHSRGERIVMTNGVFDILHPGHISVLEKAKALGDRLIIAVNNDASVQHLKGMHRPINKLAHRMAVLAALRVVDWVVPFVEDTPARLIAAVQPDVLVKGGDYKVHEIAGADFVLKNAGEVTIIPFEQGFSTTATIMRIKESYEEQGE